jgi:hypothetical protein
VLPMNMFLETAYPSSLILLQPFFLWSVFACSGLQLIILPNFSIKVPSYRFYIILGAFIIFSLTTHKKSFSFCFYFL